MLILGDLRRSLRYRVGPNDHWERSLKDHWEVLGWPWGFLSISWATGRVYTVKPVLSKHLGKAKRWFLKTGACVIQANFHLAFKGTKPVASSKVFAHYRLSLIKVDCIWEVYDELPSVSGKLLKTVKDEQPSTYTCCDPTRSPSTFTEPDDHCSHLEKETDAQKETMDLSSEALCRMLSYSDNLVLNVSKSTDRMINLELAPVFIVPMPRFPSWFMTYLAKWNSWVQVIFDKTKWLVSYNIQWRSQKGIIVTHTQE